MHYINIYQKVNSIRNVCASNRRFSPGFTLIELLLVISIMTIVGSVFYPLSLSFFEYTVLNDASDILKNNLRVSQQHAIHQKHDSSFGVQVFTDGYVVFEGSSYVGRVQSEDEYYEFPQNIAATSTQEIIFEKSTGYVQSPTTITLTLFDIDREINLTAKGIIE